MIAINSDGKDFFVHQLLNIFSIWYWNMIALYNYYNYYLNAHCRLYLLCILFIILMMGPGNKDKWVLIEFLFDWFFVLPEFFLLNEFLGCDDINFLGSGVADGSVEWRSRENWVIKILDWLDELLVRGMLESTREYS